MHPLYIFDDTLLLEESEFRRIGGRCRVEEIEEHVHHRGRVLADVTGEVHGQQALVIEPGAQI